MSYFLNRICLFSCFFIWKCIFYHNKNQIFHIYFFTVNIIIIVDSCKRVLHIVENTGWHWAMACINWEFQWIFPWYNCETRTKLVQHHFKSRPSTSFYVCTTISGHFLCGHCFLFFNLFLCIFFVNCCLEIYSSQSFSVLISVNIYSVTFFNFLLSKYY